MNATVVVNESLGVLVIDGRCALVDPLGWKSLPADTSISADTSPDPNMEMGRSGPHR